MKKTKTKKEHNRENRNKCRLYAVILKSHVVDTTPPPLLPPPLPVEAFTLL